MNLSFLPDLRISLIAMVNEAILIRETIFHLKCQIFCLLTWTTSLRLRNHQISLRRGMKYPRRLVTLRKQKISVQVSRKPIWAIQKLLILRWTARGKKRPMRPGSRRLKEVRLLRVRQSRQCKSRMFRISSLNKTKILLLKPSRQKRLLQNQTKSQLNQDT